MKRKRAQVSKAVLEQTVDDGSCELVAGQTEKKFGNVSSTLESESKAVAAGPVGVALESILAKKRLFLDLFQVVSVFIQFRVDP